MKKKLFNFSSIFFLTAFLPMTTFAASINATGVISNINNLFKALLPVLISFGVLYFVWGIISYMISADEEQKTKGRDKIIYGLIGLAVIVSVWGLVTLVTQTFGLGNGGQASPDLTQLVNTAPVGGDACTFGEKKFQDYLGYFTCVLGKSVIPFMFALAVVMFIWGMIKFFIINSDEEQKRTQGKEFMIWGIIALAVMISVWGLVAVLGTTFEIKTDVLPSVKPYAK